MEFWELVLDTVTNKPTKNETFCFFCIGVESLLRRSVVRRLPAEAQHLRREVEHIVHTEKDWP